MVLITIFGPLSGAHSNPAVTLARTLSDSFAGPLMFVLGQLAGVAVAVPFFGWLFRQEASA